LWLVAGENCLDSDGNACHDGDAIETWHDISGKSLDASANGDARPIYRTGGGTPFVEFDGSKALGLEANSLLNPADEWTIFVAGMSKIATFPYGPSAILSKGTSHGITWPSYSLAFDGTNMGASCMMNSPVDEIPPMQYSDDFWATGGYTKDAAMVWTVTYRAAGGVMTVRLRCNGVDKGGGTLVGSSIWSGGVALSIGSPATEEWLTQFIGRIYEIRLYNKIPSTYVATVEDELIAAYL
jgi:hypothetical protein